TMLSRWLAYGRKRIDRGRSRCCRLLPGDGATLERGLRCWHGAGRRIELRRWMGGVFWSLRHGDLLSPQVTGALHPAGRAQGLIGARAAEVGPLGSVAKANHPTPLPASVWCGWGR